MPRITLFTVAVSAAVVVLAAPASAKEARCFTTDDGNFPCNFVSIDGDGGFEITTPKKIMLRLAMDKPGETAYGFIGTPDSGFTALPGMYQRSAKDPGCWENNTTNTQICAW